MDVTKDIKGYIYFIDFVDFMRKQGKMSVRGEKRYIQNGFSSIP